MAKERAPNRAYLLRCWREGEHRSGGTPHWRFSLEEVLPGRGRRGFVDLVSLIAFLRASFARGKLGNGPSEPENGEWRQPAHTVSDKRAVPDSPETKNLNAEEDIMYKAVLVHEIVPGKLSELKRWFQDADRERKAKNPDYTPPKRYITVIGNLTKFYGEFALETVPVHPSVWIESIEGQGSLKDLIVAGKTELRVLKELEIES
jgi:hypothetical protein